MSLTKNIKDMSNTYTTRKAIKIATAIYMITDIMSEKEPLKWHLRTCAVSLLEADSRNIKSIIERTIDILIIAKIARAVSPMNADVLEEELKLLLSQSDCDIEEGDINVKLFQKDFFEVKLELDSPKTETKPFAQNKEEVIKENIISLKDDQPIIVKDRTNAETAKTSTTIDYNHPQTKTEAELEIARQVERPATTLIPQGIKSAFSPRISLLDEDILERKVIGVDPKASRKETILKIIKEKDNCSIKDISNKLPNVSEKTIQRELISMIEEGVISRMGDRRWSTYSIGVRQ